MMKSQSDRLPRVLRDFLRLLHWAAPLCGLFTLLNPALIIYQQDMYPLSAFFWIKLAGIGLGAAFALAAALTPLQWLLRRLKPDKGERIIPGLLGAAFVALFCITVFYPQASALQDGSTAAAPTWGQVMPLYVGYIVVWLVLAFFALRREELFCRLTLMGVIFSLGVTAYVAGMTVNQHGDIAYLSDKTDLSFGSDKNIIVIVADMLQGTALETVFNLHPELKEEFSGFTAYTRAVSPFPFTSFGLPAILSGKLYSTNSAVPKAKDNMRAAYADSFLTDAAKVGYVPLAIGYYDRSEMRGSVAWEDNILSLRRLVNFFDLGIMRIFKQRLFDRNILDAVVTSDIFIAKKNDILFLQRIAKQNIGSVSKRLLYQHNLFTHIPTAIWADSANGVFGNVAAQDDASAYLNEILFFLEQFSKVCERLKDLGLYENSLIVIVGDHGHFALPFGVQDNEDFDVFEKGFWQYSCNSYNPALLIKYPGDAKIPLQISHAVRTNMEVRKVIQRWIGPQFNVTPTENNDIDIVLMQKESTLNPFYSAESHRPVRLIGGLPNLPAIMCDPQFAKLQYTPMPLNKSIPMATVQSYGGVAKEPPQGAWIYGDSGFLALDMSAVAPERDAVLKMTVMPLLNSQHLRQHLRIFASGVELESLDFQIQGDNQVELIIPSAILQKNSSSILLKFIALNAVTPKSIGAWDYEWAKLSIFIRDLRLEQK